MIVDRYYYSQLNKKEQAIYKAFYAGVMEHKDVIPIPVKGVFTEKQFGRIFRAITLDNPLIYFLNQSACNCATDAFGHVAICPQYFYSEKKVKEFNKKIQDKVNKVAAELNLSEGTDYEKELKVHDWLCKNVRYDFQGADTNDIMRVVKSHNIVGVFSKGLAQCEGIAKAAKVLLNAVDVKCIVVEGIANDGKGEEPHAWNIIKLEDEPYQVDITWDIGAIGNNKDRIAYDYFNLSDEMMLKDHKIDGNAPHCLSMKMNYFTKNQLVFKSKTQLLAAVSHQIKRGQDELYFRLEGRLTPNNVIKDISDEILKIRCNQGINGVRLQEVSNEKLGTCRISFF